MITAIARTARVAASRRRSAALYLAFLATTSAAVAFHTLRTNREPYTQTASYAVLRDVDDFSWGRVGFGARIPEGARALNDLLDRPDADEAMKSLFWFGNSDETRLHALCGLYFTDRAAFENGVAELSVSWGSVETRSGCVSFSTGVAEIVWRGGSDVISLPDSATAVDDLKRSDIRRPLDIAHGGIPAAIRSMKSRAQATCAPTSQNPVVAEQDRSSELRR